MANCPHCGKPVSLFAGLFSGASNIRENWSRSQYHKVHTCNNCGQNYSVTISSHLIFILIGLVEMGAFLLFLRSFGKLEFIALYVIVLGITYFIWWRDLARLREPYD